MIFFNSSMPRSGSTLLQNVLAQNTEIFATPTDGSLELLYGARMNYMSCPEFKAQDRIAMQNAWRAFCRGGLLAYADSLKGGKQHICIKCRGIGVHYDWYSRFLGEPPKLSAWCGIFEPYYRQWRKYFDSNRNGISLYRIILRWQELLLRSECRTGCVVRLSGWHWKDSARCGWRGPPRNVYSYGTRTSALGHKSKWSWCTGI